MVTVTVGAVVTQVRRLAAEKPDFVYNTHNKGGCFNRNDTDVPGSGCIVGQALDTIDPTWFRVEYNSSNAQTCLEAAGAIGHVVVEDESPDGVSWLLLVQSRQDQGDTWRNAVAWADRWESVPFLDVSPEGA